MKQKYPVIFSAVDVLGKEQNYQVLVSSLKEELHHFERFLNSLPPGSLRISARGHVFGDYDLSR